MVERPFVAQDVDEAEVVRGKHIALERNPEYFGGARRPGKIGKVVVRFVPEYGTQIAELMAGNADLIWQVPKDQAERMKSRRGLNVITGDTMRYAFLRFDVTGRPGAIAEPLRKLEVRQAIRAVDVNAVFVTRAGRRISPRAIELRLAQWASRQGLDRHVHPHMLRHSFASHVLQSSGDLRAVQDMLGHASIASTQVYTHLDFQALAKVYDAAHPRAKRRKRAG